MVPLIWAAASTWAGFPVTGRDDINYLGELYTRPYLLFAPDQLSWVLLKFMVSTIPDPVFALRLVGLIIMTLTCWMLLRKRAGEWALAYFAVSILPIYLTLYFNQVRLALALAIYLLILTYKRPVAAAVGSTLAHTSTVLLLFPPAVIAAPFLLGLADLIDPTSFAAIRYAAYRDLQYLLMPWYFGWELMLLALMFLYEKKLSKAIGLVGLAVAVRLIAEGFSVDAARRLLELGLFAYSPVVTYLKIDEHPSQLVLAYYLALGLLFIYTGVAGGVVTI